MESFFAITKIDRVIFVGRDEYPEPATTFTHPLNSHELIFHISGNSTTLFNGQALPCPPNTVRFLPKGDYAQYTATREEPGDCIDVFFQSDIPPSPTAFLYNAQSNRAIGNLFQRLFSVWVGREEGYRFACVSLLCRIFSEMQKSRYLPEKQQNYIRPAVEYIHSHFLTEKISVAHLAALCGISESYLKKLFTQTFGVPPMKYILQRKARYACDLLKSGLYSPGQVAVACGYESYYYFSRQFKEYVGLSPTAFIEKHQSSK